MRLSPFLVAALLASDACFMEPACACGPAAGVAVITGMVADPSAAPVEGARVMFRVLGDDTCSGTGTITGWVQSTVSGRFRHTASWAGGTKSFCLWAEAPAGRTWATSDSQVVRVSYDGLGGAVPDSVELAFQLRP